MNKFEELYEKYTLKEMMSLSKHIYNTKKIKHKDGRKITNMEPHDSIAGKTQWKLTLDDGEEIIVWDNGKDMKVKQVIVKEAKELDIGRFLRTPKKLKHVDGRTVVDIDLYDSIRGVYQFDITLDDGETITVWQNGNDMDINQVIVKK
jgi:hypothetical protein